MIKQLLKGFLSVNNVVTGTDVDSLIGHLFLSDNCTTERGRGIGGKREKK